MILGAPWILGSSDQRIGDAATPPEHRDAVPADAPAANTMHDTKPTDEPPPRKSTPSQDQIAPPAMPPAPQESVVRRSEEALALVGIRAGDVVVITTATVWACGPDTVICPTSILDSLESNLDKYKGIAKYKGLDATLVVCAPHKTLAILEHRPGNGAAEGFSLAKLEAPLDAVCTTAASDPPLQPDQPLTMLTCWCEQKDKPGTIVRKLQQLKIDRIERSADKSPILLHCSGDAIPGDVQGSPVFDNAGSVVGCARPSAGGDVQVVPVARLVELFPAMQ